MYGAISRKLRQSQSKVRDVISGSLWCACVYVCVCVCGGGWVGLCIALTVKEDGT